MSNRLAQILPRLVEQSRLGRILAEVERTDPRLLPAAPVDRTSAHPGDAEEGGDDLHVPDLGAVPRSADVDGVHVGGLADVRGHAGADPGHHRVRAAEPHGLERARQLHGLARHDGRAPHHGHEVLARLAKDGGWQRRLLLPQRARYSRADYQRRQSVHVVPVEVIQVLLKIYNEDLNI